jgi:hypothetical protein
LLTIFPKMVSPLLLDIFGPKIIVNFRILNFRCFKLSPNRRNIVAKRN